MIQPFAEETIELKFLVGLVHTGVGIAIATVEVPLPLEIGHLGHAHIVIEMHAHARRIQHGVEHASLGHPHDTGVGRTFLELETQHSQAPAMADQLHLSGLASLQIAQQAGQAHIVGGALAWRPFRSVT